MFVSKCEPASRVKVLEKTDYVHCRHSADGCPEDLDYGCVCRCMHCKELHDIEEAEQQSDKRVQRTGGRCEVEPCRVAGRREGNGRVSTRRHYLNGAGRQSAYYWGAECQANPGTSFLEDYALDCALKYGRASWAECSNAEKVEILEAFAEGRKAERKGTQR
jgi:hypothetical protein